MPLKRWSTNPRPPWPLSASRRGLGLLAEPLAMENPKQLKDALLADVAAASDLDSLEQLRVSALGRKGRITDLMKGLGGLDPDERKATGQALNQVKAAVQSAIDARKTDLQDAELDARLVDEAVDVTLPVEFGGDGRLHPISQDLGRSDRDLRRDGIFGRRRPGHRR